MQPAAARDDLPPARAVEAVAALTDDLRRRLYGLVRDAGGPVTREAAARGVGISRKLAAFHLDKLVAVGLLTARARPAGAVRRVGRAPKVYEPADADVRVSIPARQHDLLAEILLDAVLAAGEDGGARAALVEVARRRGTEFGAAERDRTRPGRLGAERALTLVAAAVAGLGFEPEREGSGCLQLRNCPFQPLAARSPDLVCAVNLAWFAGLVDGLQAQGVEAVLAPRPGGCCVRLTAG